MTTTIVPNSIDCLQFSDDQIAAAMAGTLDDNLAGQLFAHLPNCAACQARMNDQNLAFNAAQALATAGNAESDSAVRAFVSRVRIDPPTVAEFKPGEQIDQYEVIKQIGNGGSSMVYLCRDASMNRQVALKILKQPFCSRSLRRRQQLEARLLAQLDHPWIVKAHEIKPRHFPPYIVMEYVAGGSSSRLVSNGPMAPVMAARLLAGVANAVQHAHDHGILHRDIKPSNLLVVGSYDPEDGIPKDLTLKVSDFGLARIMGDNSALTSTDNIIGTPAYMSPEQARGSQSEIGPASDIYSIGVVLYEYLIGRPPLVAENAVSTLRLVNEVDPIAPRVIRPAIPRDLNNICMKCLLKNPAERYASAKDLAEDLERFLERRPILARPIGPVNRIYRWSSRKPGLAAAISLSMVLATALLVVSMSFGFKQAQLRKVAEQNARLFHEAARMASEESDFSRNLFMASIRNSENALKKLGQVKNLADVTEVAQEIGAFDKFVIQEYLKRMQQPESLREEGFEAYFRDAVALYELGYRDDSEKMLKLLINQCLKLSSDHSDYREARMVAIKSVDRIAYMLHHDGKNSEALAVLEKYYNEFQIEYQQIDRSFTDLITIRSLLDTYIHSLTIDGNASKAGSVELQRIKLTDRIIELEKISSN